jgi:hypothetical protein
MYRAALVNSSIHAEVLITLLASVETTLLYCVQQDNLIFIDDPLLLMRIQAALYMQTLTS